MTTKERNIIKKRAKELWLMVKELNDSQETSSYLDYRARWTELDALCRSLGIEY